MAAALVSFGPMTNAAPLMLSVSGLRGITGQSLTPEVAARFAAAFGGWLSERVKKEDAGRDLRTRPVTVVIGRDGRKGGEAIMRAAVRGLTGAGCRVLAADVATTPTIGVAVDRHEADGGMVITASHNPQQWNGLKCLIRAESNADGVGTCAPAAGVAAEIIARFRAMGDGGAGAAAEPEDLETIDDAAAEHADLVLAAIDLVTQHGARGIGGTKVVLDSVNASGARAGRLLLEGLGCDLVHLNDSDSGEFPHPPEPTRENLTDLCEQVVRHGAAVGFAQDPDADRLAIIDETGRYIGEEYTLALAAESLLTSPAARAMEKVVLVTNLSTSRMLEDVVAARGGGGARVLRTPVGEANVVEVMKREGAVLGGEGNGGVIWPRVTYVRDSLSAMALVLALMARTGRPLSELVDALPRYAIEKRKVDLASREAAEPALKKLREAYAAERIDTQDGVRVDFDARRAWLHVRASNTEPIMRLIAEAPTEAEARALLDEAARVIG